MPNAIEPTATVDIIEFYAARKARLRHRNLIRSSWAVACGLCLTAALAFAFFSSECTYSFWYVTTPNTAGVTPNACWILTTKWYVPYIDTLTGGVK